MVQLRYPGGATSSRPLAFLEPMSTGSTSTIEDRLQAGHFGKLRDLQRLITFEKLKGTLHEVIYSMEAAQIDFYPYQFKPVLKFINSPTERLIIADEVGLGKTIESALIWMELQARRQAKRMLVVCPNILAEKWRDELRTKFQFDARVVKFTELAQEITELETTGPSHSFVLIGTYPGLRPPKAELHLLRDAPDVDHPGGVKTAFLRKMLHWSQDYDPFDLVIFDEAHYMRNPATTMFHLGRSLAANAGAVLCVSATPVNNSNTDLHSLLRLVDENFFETQGLFSELLEANRPAVQAGNALARTPIDNTMLMAAVEGMAKSQFISKSPLFRQFLEKLERLDPADKTQLAKCQDLAEKLNLLGGYINRTRRVQVKENRPLRDPVVLLVEYNQKEMQLYQAILQIVRHKCRRDKRPFHVFQVLGLQLRAASCLPALASEIRAGRFGDTNELFEDALGEEVFDELFDGSPQEDLSGEELGELLTYDFDCNDSKYQKLIEMLLNVVSEEKVVIFAYYRPTLNYLSRRLVEDGISVAMIHGGVNNDRRWEEIERFKDPKGPRVLLSSEVGSEGIDLQFCRVLVNYDLPWNPMRVEQRIGRIDRIGQVAEKLSIVNFKVKGTVEERLYERLHSKLERYANSLGDLEAVIGKEVQQLTVELLSQELTLEEENRRMELTENVIENRLLEIQSLEESGDALIALSDYVQRKIEEDRDRGRYILAEELEDYLTDFFEREFRGCEMSYNTPVLGCLKIRLSPEAQGSLSDFIHDDRSLSARPLRQREFSISFRRDVLQNLPTSQKRSVHFINHMSPLIRWITSVNRSRAHGFFDVSALLTVHPELPPGDYCYRIERWKLKGLSSKERLAYGFRPLSENGQYPAVQSEAMVQHLLRNSRDWDYVDCSVDLLIEAHAVLEADLIKRFSEEATDFDFENLTAHQIKEQRVKSVFARRIAQDEQRLHSMRAAGRGPRVINMTEKKILTAIENRDRRLLEMSQKAQIDMERAPVAAGVFRVSSSL
jgi:superfamily II DNA or RNA helicase